MQSNVISSSDIDRGLVDGIIPVYKDRGETPLEVLNKLKIRFPNLTLVPLSYAGRLDPLASGLLLVLSGNYNKRRDEFLGLDKTYIVEFLLGISTDSGDLMGVIDGPLEGKNDKTGEGGKLSEENIKKTLKSLVGKYDMPYPIFSSKTVDGKQLHQWAKDHRSGVSDISKLDIPMQKANVKNIEYLGTSYVTAREVSGLAIELISSVNGDFRQSEIIEQWKTLHKLEQEFIKVKIKIDVGSGTYMRTLASLFAEKLETCGLAYSIHREKVGGVDVDEAIVIV